MKLVPAFLLATYLMMICISCTKQTIVSPSTLSAASSDNAVMFQIGQHYGGGIIFYLDSVSQHGLIFYDGGDVRQSVPWLTLSNYTGANATRIGKGKSNTKKICQAGGQFVVYAALACQRFKFDGYNDWYLPSLDELEQLYLHKELIPVMSSSYWSSTEFDNFAAWQISFVDGTHIQVYKGGASNAIAIRTF